MEADTRALSRAPRCCAAWTLTETASDGDVHARAHADQQSREERDEQRRRADGAEGDIPREFTRDGDVAEVEKDLKKLRQHQRNAEQKHIFPERAVCELNCTPRAADIGRLARHME